MGHLLLIFIDDRELGETTVEHHRMARDAHTMKSAVTYRPTSECTSGTAAHRSEGSSEHRRRGLILDTERYLSSPHSKGWARVNHARPNRRSRPWRGLPAA